MRVSLIINNVKPSFTNILLLVLFDSLFCVTKPEALTSSSAREVEILGKAAISKLVIHNGMNDMDLIKSAPSLITSRPTPRHHDRQPSRYV